MDLLKTPSVQSLLDSDLESVESFQYLDIEEVKVNYLYNYLLLSLALQYYHNIN